MQGLRGPDAPIPDSVPDELIAMYGEQARVAVRARRSRWVRLRARARAWSAEHEPAFLWGAAFMWLLILVCLATAMALAVMGRPGATFDASILGGVAGLGAAST